jgi:hypothetical protein
MATMLVRDQNLHDKIVTNEPVKLQSQSDPDSLASTESCQGAFSQVLTSYFLESRSQYRRVKMHSCVHLLTCSLVHLSPLDN